MTDKDGFDLQKYKLDVSGMVVTELFQIITSQRKLHGEEFSNELILSITCSILATVVHKAIATGNTQVPTAGKDYQIMKLAIENTVASAFTGAFLSLGQKEMPEFICQIIKIPPPASATLN